MRHWENERRVAEIENYIAIIDKAPNGVFAWSIHKKLKDGRFTSAITMLGRTCSGVETNDFDVRYRCEKLLDLLEHFEDKVKFAFAPFAKEEAPPSDEDESENLDEELEEPLDLF